MVLLDAKVEEEEYGCTRKGCGLRWVCRWRHGVGRITIVSTNEPTATVASCVAGYPMQERGLWYSFLKKI